MREKTGKSPQGNSAVQTAPFATVDWANDHQPRDDLDDDLAEGVVDRGAGEDCGSAWLTCDRDGTAGSTN